MYTELHIYVSLIYDITNTAVARMREYVENNGHK